MHTFLVLLLLAQLPNLPALNGTVTGVLRTTSGAPAAGVRVTAVVPPASAEDAFKATAMASISETDSEGRYRLEGVPPGRYYISAGRVDSPTYYPGSSILTDGTLVMVTPGATSSSVDFVLRNESAGRATIPMILNMALPGFHLSVTIRVDGGGKVPVFHNGRYPVLRATNVSSKDVFEIPFSGTTLILPLPSGSKTDEYNVTVNDLQGYAVQSVAHGSTDLQKEKLAVQSQGLNLQQSLLGTPLTGPFAFSPMPITVVLTSPPALATGGARVTGRSVGAGADIYLSNIPGTLYSDGTFEFQGVLPGSYNIVKILGSNVTAAPVIVGNRDLDGISLQRSEILPINVFEEAPKAQDGDRQDSKAHSMMSIAGRVLDETSQEELSQGTVTLAGYGSARRSFAIVGGSFLIRDLLPGRYNLTINVHGYVAATQPVTLGMEDLKLDLIARKETQ